MCGLGFCVRIGFFHDATYEISTHVTVHGVGPITCDKIVVGFTFKKFPVAKTSMIAVGTLFEIHGLLHSDDVWIHFAAHAAFFDSAESHHIQNFITGHC